MNRRRKEYPKRRSDSPYSGVLEMITRRKMRTQFQIREYFEIQLTIKISEIRLQRFVIILTPLSSRNKDNGRVSNLNTNKGDRVC